VSVVALVASLAIVSAFVAVIAPGAFFAVVADSVTVFALSTFIAAVAILTTTLAVVVIVFAAVGFDYTFNKLRFRRHPSFCTFKCITGHALPEQALYVGSWKPEPVDQRVHAKLRIRWQVRGCALRAAVTFTMLVLAVDTMSQAPGFSAPAVSFKLFALSS
jgi:hypothetical protein